MQHEDQKKGPQTWRPLAPLSHSTASLNWCVSAIMLDNVLGVNMPGDTRRRIRGSVTSIHGDLETWPRVGADAGEAQKANKHRPVS